MLDDLVPMTGSGAVRASGALDTRSIEELAVAEAGRRVAARRASMGFLIPTLICWVDLAS